MDIEVITTKKKLTKSIFKQLPTVRLGVEVAAWGASPSVCYHVRMSDGLYGLVIQGSILVIQRTD